MTASRTDASSFSGSPRRRYPRVAAFACAACLAFVALSAVQPAGDGRAKAETAGDLGSAVDLGLLSPVGHGRCGFKTAADLVRAAGARNQDGVAAASLGTWQLSASGGFGNRENFMAGPFAAYKGELYVGVSNGSGCEVRVKRNDAWIPVNTPGFGDADNEAVLSMEAYGGRLYVGTFNLRYGCEVWSYDGAVWVQEVGKDPAGTPGTGNGFGNYGNIAAISMEAHGSKLYVGTVNLKYGYMMFPPFVTVWSDGGEVWAYDGSWTRVVGGGFGDARNMGVTALKEHGSGIYAGTLYAELSIALAGSTLNLTLAGRGCQLWKQGTGNWIKIAGEGIGDADNAAIMAMESYAGKLLMGTVNGGLTVGIDINTMSITGIDWQSDGLCIYGWDGAAVSRVVEGGFKGVGGIGVFSMAGLAAGGKELLLVGSGREEEGEDGSNVVKSLLMVFDGQNWSRGAEDAFGNPDNMLDMSLTAWDGQAYVGTVNPEDGCEIWRGAPPLPMTSFYFAEGYTGNDFQEYLCLGNPAESPLQATITYLFKDGGTQQRILEVPPNSRATVDVNSEVGPDKEVSAKIEAAQPFIAERPMYFNYQGRWTGGHDAVGATAPATTWYFAEGYTGSGFEEWICVLNPGDAPANLAFHFQTQEQGPRSVEGLSVTPHSRGSFKVNDLLAGRSYQTSLKLVSDQPVVAERPMYFDYTGRGNRHWEGGHCVVGATKLEKQYFFAEGTTRAGFEEWLTIQNPNPTPITVRAVFQLGPGQGDAVSKTYGVEANRRATVFVPDEVGGDKDVSAYLSSDSPFLAERPAYFRYSYVSLSAEGGHCVIGAASPAAEWFLAEGYTGSGFDQWLCLQNPADTEALAEVAYYTQEAGALPPRRVSVPPRTRYTIMVNEHAGAGYQLSTRVKVLSGPGIVVERPMYFIYRGWDGGHDVVGYAP